MGSSVTVCSDGQKDEVWGVCVWGGTSVTVCSDVQMGRKMKLGVGGGTSVTVCTGGQRCEGERGLKGG